MLNFSLYVRILILADASSSYFCSLFQCCQYFLMLIIYILCEMWLKIILLHFYPQTQRRPAKLLKQFFFFFVRPCLQFFFFFCSNFTQITRQTASEPSKIIPKAISFICSPKNRLQKPVNASSQLITQTLYRSQSSILMERHLERLNWRAEDVNMSRRK